MNTIASGKLNFFRYVAIAEGISYLLLLFIAMPLKYYMGMPEAVKITGWIHGLLFILYIVALVNMQITLRWPLLRFAWAFLASLIPFGPFILDRQLIKNRV